MNGEEEAMSSPPCNPLKVGSLLVQSHYRQELSTKLLHSSTFIFPFILRTKLIISVIYFLHSLFAHSSESTYRHQATIDDEVVSMEILDTAGQVNRNSTKIFSTSNKNTAT